MEAVSRLGVIVVACSKGGGLKMGLPGLINHRQSRESASKRPRPLKVNDENFVTGRSVRAIVDRGGPVICFHSLSPPGNEGNRKNERII